MTILTAPKHTRVAFTPTELDEPNKQGTLFNPAGSANKAQSAREQLFKDLNTYNRISSTASGSNCLRSSRRASIGTPLYKTHSSKGVKASWGKQTCNSAFCPVCSTRRGNKNAFELTLATQKHIANGGTALFLTLGTRSEKVATPLFSSAEYGFRRDKEAFKTFRDSTSGLPAEGAAARMRQAVADYAAARNLPINTHKSWEVNTAYEAMSDTLAKTVFSGREWRKDLTTYGIKGRVTVVEVVPTPTVKRNGWRDWEKTQTNIHFHIVLFLAGHPTARQRETLATRIQKRWAGSLNRKGHTTAVKAQDYKWVAGNDLLRVIDYINKLPRDLITGKAHEGKLTIWDALRDAECGGVNLSTGELFPPNASARNYFQQLEQVFYRKRLIRTSERFAETMGIANELEARRDQFLQDTLRETVLVFRREDWQALITENPNARYSLLNLAENADNDAVYERLDAEGVAYLKPLTPVVSQPVEELADLMAIPDDPAWFSDEVGDTA